MYQITDAPADTTFPAAFLQQVSESQFVIGWQWGDMTHQQVFNNIADALTALHQIHMDIFPIAAAFFGWN